MTRRCLAIALLYLGIVARVLIKLLDEDNSFAILAGAGLAITFESTLVCRARRSRRRTRERGRRSDR